MKKLSIVLVGLFVVGCAGTSDVLQLGSGIYEITAQEHNVSGGLAGAKTNAIKTARKFCAAKDSELNVKYSSDSFDRPFYTYTATFECSRN